MKTLQTPITIGSIVLLIYLAFFLTSSVSEISLILFISAHFILILIGYNILNHEPGGIEKLQDSRNTKYSKSNRPIPV